MTGQPRNLRPGEPPLLKDKTRVDDRGPIPISTGMKSGQMRTVRERISALSSAAEELIELIPQAMLVCDAEGTITHVNSLAQALIEASLRGSSLHLAPAIWGELCDLRGRSTDVHHWPLMQALHGKSVLAGEYRLTRWDGRIFDLLCGAVPIRELGQDKIIGALGTFTDVTHLNRRCLKLRAAAVLNERRRMAADIHDTLCQGLNAVVVQIESGLEHFPSGLHTARQHFMLAQQGARESLAEARHSMWTLAQTPDQIGDLSRVLPAMVARILAGTEIKVNFYIQPEVRTLSRFVRTQVHSILREAVRNILKHSEATLVEIVISCDRTVLHISVQDNGKGFTHSAGIAAGRFGLASMRERTHRLGGQITIQSEPEHGTRICVSIPLLPRISGRS